MGHEFPSDLPDVYKRTANILSAINPDLEAERRQINPFDAAYHGLVKRILTEGSVASDRTGTGTIKISGGSLDFDLGEGFPLITSKFTWWEGIGKELLWFISGETNIQPLVNEGVGIWNEWAWEWYVNSNQLRDKFPRYSQDWEEGMQEFIARIKTDNNFAGRWGEIGPVYGYQWRHWKNPDGTEIDQLQNAINRLEEKPGDRRIIVNAWNPSVIEELAVRSLPPCHAIYQFVVTHDRQTGERRLNCVMTMRSTDVFLGLPFNIGSYAALTLMVGHLVGMKPGILTVHMGDTHLYLNHLDQVEELMLDRTSHTAPIFDFNFENGSVSSIDDFNMGHLVVSGYKHSGKLEAPISV